MSRVSWKRWALGGGGVVVVIVVVALAAQAMPRPLVVPTTAQRITGAEIGALDRRLTPFRAEYRRWTRILGVPVGGSAGIVTAQPVEPGMFEITFDLDGFGEDRMRLDGTSLVLVERAFGDPGGPGQSFVRDGDTFAITVRGADGASRDLTREYPVAVLEPSLLELPLAVLDLAVGDAGQLAWSNFNDASDIWIPFRVLADEAILAAGRSFDTSLVRVRFPGGRQRDYWIADEPPYKVRMVAYERGTLVTSGWDLLTVEAFD